MLQIVIPIIIAVLAFSAGYVFGATWVLRTTDSRAIELAHRSVEWEAYRLHLSPQEQQQVDERIAKIAGVDDDPIAEGFEHRERDRRRG